MKDLRAEQLAELDKALEQEITALRSRLRADLRSAFERELASLRTRIEVYEKTAGERYRKNLADLEEKKRSGKYPASALRCYEESLAREFEATRLFREKVLKAFVASCRLLLGS